MVPESKTAVQTIAGCMMYLPFANRWNCLKQGRSNHVPDHKASGLRSWTATYNTRYLMETHLTPTRTLCSLPGSSQPDKSLIRESWGKPKICLCSGTDHCCILYRPQVHLWGGSVQTTTNTIPCRWSKWCITQRSLVTKQLTMAFLLLAC